MSVYLHATLELRYDTLPKFLELGPRLKEVLEKVGWKLTLGLVTKIGTAATVMHIWKLDDMNHFDKGIAAMGSHPEAAALYGAICETGVRETLVFADATAYSP